MTKKYTLLFVCINALLLLFAAGCGAAPKVTTMDILLTEWEIEPQSETLNAGLVTFNVTNNGALEHNFIIEGTDVHIELILSTKTESVEVELAPGEYKLICNLPGHNEAGMETTITISE